MGAIAFAMPILPDKIETDRDLFAEMEGSRREEYEEARRKAGVTREAVWHQETPDGTVAVVYLEAEDVGAAMMAIATSEEPFNRWFRERIEDIHGVDMAEPAPPPQQVLDSRF